MDLLFVCFARAAKQTNNMKMKSTMLPQAKSAFHIAKAIQALGFRTRGEIHENLAILPAPIQIPAADVYDQPDRDRRRVSAGDGARAARARVLQPAHQLRRSA